MLVRPWTRMGSRDFSQGTQMCSEHSSVVMGTATHSPLLHTLEGTPASTRQAELGFPKPMSGPVGFFLPLSPGLTVLPISPYSMSVHAYGSAPPPPHSSLPSLMLVKDLQAFPGALLLLHSPVSSTRMDCSSQGGLRTVPTQNLAHSSH